MIELLKKEKEMLRLEEKHKGLAPGSKRKLVHYPWYVKLEVVLEALNSKTTQAEVSRKFGVSQPIISVWKRSALECLEEHFRSGNRVKRRAPLTDSHGEESNPSLAEAVHRLAEALQRGSLPSPFDSNVADAPSEKASS